MLGNVLLEQIVVHIILAGIAYLIIKSVVYGFRGLPYIQTHAPRVITFLEASKR